MSWFSPVSGAGAALLIFRWWRRRSREQRIARDLGDANQDGSEVDVSHLTPGLGRIALHSATLRLLLETPMRRIREPLLSESPWARRERCDEYDNALVEIRRAMWDWIAEIERLGPEDRQMLAELGFSTRPYRAFLFLRFDRTNDPWEQVVWAEAPDLERVHTELVRTILELKTFEQRLAEYRFDPYRAAS